MLSNQNKNENSIIVTLASISIVIFLLLGFTQKLREPVVTFSLYLYGEEVNGKFINFSDNVPTGYIFNYNGNTYTNTNRIRSFYYNSDDYPHIEYGESDTAKIILLPKYPDINVLENSSFYAFEQIKNFIIFFITLIFGLQYIIIELIYLVKSVFNIKEQKRKLYIGTILSELSLAGVCIFFIYNIDSMTLKSISLIIILSIYLFLFNKIENFNLVITIYILSGVLAFFCFYEYPFIIMFSFFIAFKIILETTITHLNINATTPLIFTVFQKKIS